MKRLTHFLNITMDFRYFARSISGIISVFLSVDGPESVALAKRHLLRGRICALAVTCCSLTNLSGQDRHASPVVSGSRQSVEFVAKIHSTGHSPYSGVYNNRHLNGEFNIRYSRRHFGAFVSKCVDFADMHSGLNFTTAGIHYAFQLTKSLQFLPYVGYFLDQRTSLIGEHSNLWAAAEFKWAITPRFFLKNTALFVNLDKEETAVALSNRINAQAAIGKFKVDMFIWYTHALKDAPHYASVSLAVTSPDWKLSDAVSVRVQVAGLQQISNQRPENAMVRGVLFSLIIPVEWSVPMRKIK